MTEFINKFTGEVKKRDFGSPIWRPVPDYEHYEPGTSLTAPDQVESLKFIIDRCKRGEILNIKQKQAIEVDLTDAELSLVDGTADLADVDALVRRATEVATDEANSEVEAQSAVGKQVSSPGQETAESKTKSADSSESKG